MEEGRFIKWTYTDILAMLAVKHECTIEQIKVAASRGNFEPPSDPATVILEAIIPGKYSGNTGPLQYPPGVRQDGR